MRKLIYQQKGLNRDMGRRYRDIKKVGGSKVVPYKQGEPAQQRHERRLAVNTELFAEAAQKWGEEFGVLVSITNKNHHWKFWRDESFKVEWWPSSAKCVINAKWSKGIHVHDWNQLQRILEQNFRKLSPIERIGATPLSSVDIPKE